MPRRKNGFSLRFPKFKWIFFLTIVLAIPLTVWSLNNVSTQFKQHAATRLMGGVVVTLPKAARIENGERGDGTHTLGAILPVENRQVRKLDATMVQKINPAADNSQSLIDLSDIKTATSLQAAAVQPASESTNTVVAPSDVSLPPVGFQGNVNSCTSWATGYYLRGYYARKDGYYPKGGQIVPPDGSFAPMYLYSQLSPNDTGTKIIDNLAILKNQGIDTRADYCQGDYDFKTLPTSDEKTNASQYKIIDFVDRKDWQNFKWLITQQIQYNKNPVVIGFLTSPKTMDANSNDCLIDDFDDPNTAGGHAVFAYAIDDYGVWIENSWGTSWGCNGFGRLSWDFILARGAEVGYYTSANRPTNPVYPGGKGQSVPGCFSCTYLKGQKCIANNLTCGRAGVCSKSPCCPSTQKCCMSDLVGAGGTTTPTPTISPYSCLKIAGQTCVSNSYACSAWGYKNGTCGASPCCQSTAYQCCQTNPNAATPTPTKAAATPTPTTGATGACTGTQMGCGNRTTSANGVYPYYTTYATTQVCNNGTLTGNPNGGCPTGSYCALTAAGTAVCTNGCTQRGYTCQTGCTNGLAGGNNGYACPSGGNCCNPPTATTAPQPTTPPTSCCPSDSRVFAGQTQSFSTPNNCGNYDYNCDGQQTIVGTYYAQSGLTSSVRLNCVGGTCGSCTNGNYTPPFTNSYTTSCGQPGGTNCTYSYFNPGQTVCPASGTASYRAGCTSTITACN